MEIFWHNQQSSQACIKSCGWRTLTRMN
jgi:hypothetical protein